MPTITELERIAAKVTHCESCGDTWYDSGIGAASCPHCLTQQLAKELDEAKNRNEALDAAQERILAIGHEHRSEFLGAVQGRIIALGHKVPAWPDYEDDVESAAQLIIGLLRQLDDLERLRKRSNNRRRELHRLNKWIGAMYDGAMCVAAEREKRLAENRKERGGLL
jgi:hypothetical protein